MSINRSWLLPAALAALGGMIGAYRAAQIIWTPEPAPPHYDVITYSFIRCQLEGGVSYFSESGEFVACRPRVGTANASLWGLQP